MTSWREALIRSEAEKKRVDGYSWQPIVEWAEQHDVKLTVA